MNRSLIRKRIRDKGSATRREIAASTQVGVTTVRTLLTEMLNENEIIMIGYDESLGGRKAVRYALKKDCFFGIVLCLDKEKIRYALVNICGEMQQNPSVYF